MIISSSVNKERVLCSFSGTMIFGKFQEFLGYSRKYGFGSCYNQELNSFTLNTKSDNLNIELNIGSSGVKVKDFTNNKFYIVARFVGKHSSFSFQLSDVDFHDWDIDEKAIDIYINLIKDKKDFFINNMEDFVEYEISFINYI